MECRSHSQSGRTTYLPPEVLDQILLHVGARDVAVLKCTARLLSALTIDDVIVRLVHATCAPLLRRVGRVGQSRCETVLRDGSGARMMVVRAHDGGSVTLLWHLKPATSPPCLCLLDMRDPEWRHAEMTRFTLPDVVRLVTRVYHSKTPELAALAPGGRVAALRDVVRGWTPQCWIDHRFPQRSV
jgi:hypothetical protein